MTDRPQEPYADDTRPIVPPENTVEAQLTTGKKSIRDRMWSLRAVIAVALASVILGGLAGAAIATVSSHEDSGRFGPGHGRFGGPGGPGGPFGPGNGNGNGGPGQQRGFGNGQHQQGGRSG